MKSKMINLDSEIADNITLINLQNYRKLIKKSMKQFKKGKGYHHPDDVILNIKVLAALDIIIKEFGG